MANEYYERLSEMNPGELADGLAMEAELDAISQGFSKLPTPHAGGQGFDGPVRVGDAVNSDEAVNKGQLDNALGTAKLLPIATYGDFNAAAWAALPSGSYLLFGTGSQFSNVPWALTVAKTYSVAVRHVIGDAGVSLYLDEVVLSSTDDTAHVDIGRPAYRLGQTLAGAYGAGWNGMALKKGGLTPLEALTPAADRLPYYNGANGAALTTLTAFARSLLDDTGAAEALATLGALGAAGGISIGDQFGITAPQFANDKKFATTEFVQRALGNFNSHVAIMSNWTLTAAEMGMSIQVGDCAITLPSAASIPAGSAVNLLATGYGLLNVTGGASFVVGGGDGNVVTSWTLNRGDEAVCVSNGTVWIVFGTTSLKQNSQFGASIAGSGYQKLPSGLIVQWGLNISSTSGVVVVTLPLSWPNGPLLINATAAIVGSSVTATVSGGSGTTIEVSGWNADGARTATQIYWLVIGH